MVKARKGAVPGVIVVSVDGSCCPCPNGHGGAGIVILDGHNELRVSEYLGVLADNNEAELLAALRALELIARPRMRVELHTDSSFVVGMIVERWAFHGKPRKTVIGRKLRKKLRRFRDLHIIQVKGHAGNPLNHLADKLAKTAARERRTEVLSTLDGTLT